MNREEEKKLIAKMVDSNRELFKEYAESHVEICPMVLVQDWISIIVSTFINSVFDPLDIYNKAFDENVKTVEMKGYILERINYHIGKRYNER